MSPSSLGTRLRGRGVTPDRAARWVVRLASGYFSNDLPLVRVPSDRANLADGWRQQFRCSQCGTDRTDSVVTSRHNQRPW